MFDENNNHSSVILTAAIVVVVLTSNTLLTNGLSLHPTQRHCIPNLSNSVRATTTTCLNLGPIDDLSNYGKQKNESELDTLRNKREQLKAKKIANIKPDDDTPKVKDMTDEEIAAMFSKKNKNNKSTVARGSSDGPAQDGIDVDDLFAKDYMPDFKIKRAGNSNRGLSGGDSRGIFEDPNDPDAEEPDTGLFVDWTKDYMDENEFHIPNRLGFTTCDWGNSKVGFVSGKLKKKERKMGKFNKTDLKVSVCLCMKYYSLVCNVCMYFM